MEIEIKERSKGDDMCRPSSAMVMALLATGLHGTVAGSGFGVAEMESFETRTKRMSALWKMTTH